MKIEKGSEDWELMSDVYKVYSKAIECENPSITKDMKWVREVQDTVDGFVNKYRNVRPIAVGFGLAITKYIAENVDEIIGIKREVTK